MVRVFLKGGVWKNSEDEILKAAVQKYGKQQWARVASLLNRKTAKQAKARWHEWLDPSIRKTEWSRPEEEKLLHLAKLLPAQWKTIAPLVGRTAVQCQEHYELVLDQAATATSTPNDTDETLRQHAAASLRPGQIDSHPESKPAKPDPMDMDEDEMEMLQEARARLANTQGKKAKRKQRERILAAAKRLADLQKRRELKQAGLLSARARTKSKTRKKEIDFGVEIPFYKPAPAGFHAVAGEDARAKDLQRKRLASVNFKKVNENQYRTRDRDAAAAKRREESRLRVLEESNEKYASAKSKTVEDELPATTFRNSLQLPAPMEVDEDDVMQGKQRTMPTPPTAGTAATQTLLGDYSSRPLPTPMRQPTATVVDLNRQATQLRQLERGQTPLLATATRMEEPPMNNGMDDDDANDMDRKLPARPTTPGGRSTAAGRTPIRDPLGLNASSASVASQYTQPQSQPSQWPAGADDHSVSGSTLASMSIRDLARQERRAAKRARADLEAALAALPAPQFEYELTAPGPDPDDAVGDMLVETVEEDAADIEAATLEDQRRQAQLEYEARNSVVKRMELPRPTGRSDRNDFVVLPTIDTNTDNTTVSRMIEDEMQTLLQHDAVAFPIVVDKKKKKKRKLMEDAVPQLTKEAVVVLDVIPADHLETARTMIQAELEVVLDEKIALVLRDGKATTRDDALEFLCHENARVSQEGAIDQAYRTDQGWVRAESDQDRIASLRDEYECLEQATAALKKKHDKAAVKLSVTTGGYAKRATKLTKDTLEAFADLDKSRIEESVYRMLQSQEIQGGTNRIEELERDIVALRASEAKLQARYGELAMAERRKKMVAANSKQ